VKLPTDYEDTVSADAHRATEAIQEQIRAHIVTTGDMRPFSLLHLLSQASLRVEQALWPEDFDRMRREIEAALRETDNANVTWCSHEKVIRSLQERMTR
jgi:hypothetical protein